MPVIFFEGQKTDAFLKLAALKISNTSASN